MKNVTTHRRIRLSAIIIGLCFMIFAAASIGSRTIYAAESKEFLTEVSITGGHFNSSLSVTPDTNPSGFSGEYLAPFALDGKVIAGIIPLDDQYSLNKDKIKLNQYPEYKDDKAPKTPFSNTEKYPGADSNALMINMNGTAGAYGFSSSSAITLAANSFYKFSAWVKTGNSGGAAFTLKGLNDPVGLWNINTVSDLNATGDIPVLTESNNYGWKQQFLYVAVGPDEETDAKLCLSMGDCAVGVYDDDFYYSVEKGYALFDTVTAVQMSPTNFYRETENLAGKTNVCIYDKNPNRPGENNFIRKTLGQSTAGADMGSFTAGKSGWSIIKNVEGDPYYDEDNPNKFNNVTYDIYNGNKLYDPEEAFGMSDDPYTPVGKLPGTTDKINNILVLSSFDKANSVITGDEEDIKYVYKDVSAGVRSEGVTIESGKYYLLTAWYATQGGGGATLAVTGQSTSYYNEHKLNPVVSETLTSSDLNIRYGWQRTRMYIRGSLIKDVEINIELWLGYNGTKSSGVAMFDDITLQEVEAKEFYAFRDTVKSFSIDTEPTDNGVTNGHFGSYTIDKDLDLPTPTDWTFIKTQDSTSVGYSTDEVSVDDAVYGVIPTDKTHYEANQSKYFGIARPSVPASEFYNINDNKNVLIMASEIKTAFGYRSSVISIPAETTQKITVGMISSLRGDYSGDGANLLLKTSKGVVLATIEHIVCDGFTDYSFYVTGGGEQVDVIIEIWFGMTDRTFNKSRLSSGYIFVNSVTAVTLSDASELDGLSAEGRGKYYGKYTFGAYDFSDYDPTDTSTIKKALNMELTSTDKSNVKYGIITFPLPAIQTDVLPHELAKKHLETDSALNVTEYTNILYLRNLSPAFTRLTTANTLSLGANSYYRVDFSMLVELDPVQEGLSVTDKSIGASITLTLNNRTLSMTDIRDTISATEHSEGLTFTEFQTFSFFISTGSDAINASWELALGGSNVNEYISGTVCLNMIAVTNLESSVEYDKAVSEIDELRDDDENINTIRQTYLKLSEETPETEDTTSGKKGCNDVQWFVVPSILLVVAILIAVGGVITKKIIASKPFRRKKRGKAITYDRKDTLHLMADEETDTLAGDEDDKREDVLRPASPDSVFDSFDEEVAPSTVKTKKAHVTTTDRSVAQDTVTDATQDELAATKDTKSTEVYENEFDD